MTLLRYEEMVGLVKSLAKRVWCLVTPILWVLLVHTLYPQTSTNTRLLRLQNSDKFWFSLVRLRPCLGLRCRQLQLIATVDPTISVNWLDSLQGTEPLGTGRPKSLRRAQNHQRYVTHIAHEWTNSFPTCKQLKVRHERHAKIPLSLSPWITSHLMIYIKFI